MNNNLVICVWVNCPNDLSRNRVYSTHVDELYLEYDPFIGVNGDGVIYAQTPCWSLLRMPVPTILYRSHRDAVALLLVHSATHDGTAQGAAYAETLKNAATYLISEWRQQ